jgi:hypothetical protein
VTGGWWKLHNEELRNLYSSPSIIRIINSKKDEMGRSCSTNGRKRGIYMGYWLETRRKEPLGRQRRRWMDNIKMDLREMGWCGMDWIDLVQVMDQWKALVNMIKNLRVP